MRKWIEWIGLEWFEEVKRLVWMELETRILVNGMRWEEGPEDFIR